jgi:hypothetical protein
MKKSLALLGSTRESQSSTLYSSDVAAFLACDLHSYCCDHTAKEYCALSFESQKIPFYQALVSDPCTNGQ